MTVWVDRSNTEVSSKKVADFWLIKSNKFAFSIIKMYLNWNGFVTSSALKLESSWMKLQNENLEINVKVGGSKKNLNLQYLNKSPQVRIFYLVEWLVHLDEQRK